jgi:hypothetical protein
MRAPWFVLGLLAAGCGRQAALSEVPGTYVMNRGRAADTLFVRADGHYRRTYVYPGQQAVVDTGAWTVDTSGADIFVTFAGFLARWRAETDPPVLQAQLPATRGYWATKPERTASGRVQIVVDPDDGWAYVRKEGTH